MSNSTQDPAAQAPSNRWLPFLYAAIVIAYGAWMSSHVLNQGEPAQASEQPSSAAIPALSEEALIALTQDATAMQAGAESFKSTCATCHGAEGQGLVGPNLTDAYWLHGAAPAQIHKTIAHGVIEKGMPGWELSLGAERVNAITAYVLTMKNRNVPGKPPQGEKAEERGAGR